MIFSHTGQPLTIIGTTGPLLAFVKVIHETCVRSNVPFLPVYAWIGLWSSLMLFLSSFFSTSNVVDYFTRFTDDIFSSLISVIFIFEAFQNLIGSFMNPAVPGLNAAFSAIIAFTTFFTANTLSKIRKTPFLARKARELVADFAPVIGILTGMIISQLAAIRYPALSLPTLNVPLVLGTTSGRPWLVDIWAISDKLKFLCFFPALMAFVLLFMDQNITVRLIMAKENKLKKGNGIHLDMFVVAAVTAITR